MEPTELEKSDYIFVRRLGEPSVDYWVQCHRENQVPRAELEKLVRWLQRELPEEAAQLEAFIRTWYGTD